MSADQHSGGGAGQPGVTALVGHTHPHPPDLAHHFDDIEQQSEATTLGMWMFLITEILFFGGLFLVYTISRSQHPHAFGAGSHHLSLPLGATNTVVLIVSSLTMAMGVRAAALRDRKGVQIWLILTLILGSVFLGIKAIEYTEKFHHHLWPDDTFQWHGPDSQFVRMYFTIYFALTGLHATHMIIGIAILAIILAQGSRGPLNQRYATRVETMGLYWHFVDIVWIFLFPLLYLLGRH